MLTVRRRNANAAVVLAALGAVSAAATVALTEVPQAIHRLPASVRAVALTFDDGPDRVWTPQVLTLLRAHHARATFFIVGERALARPDLVRAELRLGEVGDHTASHRDLQRLPVAAAREEIARGADEIAQAGAPRPTLFRPPIGHETAGLIDWALHSEGLRTVLWTVAVERYTNHEPTTAAVRDVLARVRPGAIILAHDGGPPGRARTLAALPGLLDGLRRRGYRVVSVGDLLSASRHAPPSR